MEMCQAKMNADDTSENKRKSLPCLLDSSPVILRRSHSNVETRVKGIVAKFESQKARASTFSKKYRSYSESNFSYARNRIKPAIRRIIDKFENPEKDAVDSGEYTTARQCIDGIDEQLEEVQLRKSNGIGHDAEPLTPSACKRNKSYIIAVSNDYYQRGDIREEKINNYVNRITTIFEKRTDKNFTNASLNAKRKHHVNYGLSAALEGNKITQSSSMNHIDDKSTVIQNSSSNACNQRKHTVKPNSASDLCGINKLYGAILDLQMCTEIEDSAKKGNSKNVGEPLIKSSNLNENVEGASTSKPFVSCAENDERSTMYRSVCFYKIGGDQINKTKNKCSDNVSGELEDRINTCDNINEYSSCDEGEYNLDEQNLIEECIGNLQTITRNDKKERCQIITEVDGETLKTTEEICDMLSSSKPHVIKCDKRTFKTINKQLNDLNKSSIVRFLSVPNLCNLSTSDEDVPIEELTDVNDDDVDETYVIMLNLENTRDKLVRSYENINVDKFNKKASNLKINKRISPRLVNCCLEESHKKANNNEKIPNYENCLIQNTYSELSENKSQQLEAINPIINENLCNESVYEEIHICCSHDTARFHSRENSLEIKNVTQNLRNEKYIKGDIINELIETEKKYIQDLRRIVKDYIPEVKSNNTPPYLLGKGAFIFGNVKLIYRYHKHEFLPQLSECKDLDDIADCFINNEEIFNLYTYYIRNKPRSDEIMKHYGNFFKEKQNELLDSLDLSCYLLVPIQRLGKYPLMLKKLIVESKKKNEVNVKLEMALSILENNMQKGNDLIAVDAIQNCKIIITEQGQLLLRDQFRCSPANRKYSFGAMVFLFEGVILITQSMLMNGSEYYIYKDSISMNDLGYTNLEDNEHEFKIWYRKPDKKIYTLYTKNPVTKTKWTNKIYSTLWNQLESSRRKKKLEFIEQGIYQRIVPIATTSEDIKQAKEKLKPQKSTSQWYF